MAASPPSAPGRIFISYRREETAYPAGWLYDRLAERFGSGQVFKDVDSIQLGDDFVAVITGAVGSCDVLLALIGKEWLTATDERGRRRLDDPDDFVRLEVEAALAREVRVIPILVDGAKMPTAEQLPASLAKLVRRQALELSPARFDSDLGRLLKVLEATLAETRAGPATPGPAPAPAGPQRKRGSRRAWVLAGTGAALVLVLVLAVAAMLADSGTTTPPTGAATTGAVITARTAAATTTPAPAAGEEIFSDNFSSRAGGWEGDPGAAYAGGAYRISAPPSAKGGGAGSLAKASGVYPSAPPRIRITVQARRLPASDTSMGYGILCRSTGNDAYVLMISDGYAKIEQWGSSYKLLKEASPRVDPYARNKLQAVCSGGSGNQPVRLQLWVNGRKVVETTDREKPIPPAAVGLAVGTDKTTRASVALFDDFAVEKLA
jgi:hypothetical protein